MKWNSHSCSCNEEEVNGHKCEKIEGEREIMNVKDINPFRHDRLLMQTIEVHKLTRGYGFSFLRMKQFMTAVIKDLRPRFV